MGTGYSPHDLEVVRRTGQLPPGARDRARGITRNPAIPASAYDALMPRYGDTLYGAPYLNPARSNYAGFGTAGEFGDYVRGRGLGRYDDAQAYAADLYDMADPARLQADYDAAKSAGRSAYEGLMPTYMEAPEARAEMLRQADAAGPGSARGAERMLDAPVDRNLRIQTTPATAPTNRSLSVRADSGPDPAARGMSVALGGTWDTDDQVVASRDGVNYVLPAERRYTATVGDDGGMVEYAAAMGGYPTQTAMEPMTTVVTEAQPGQPATYRNIGEELFNQYVGADQESAYNAWLAELDKWQADTAALYGDYRALADETAAIQPHEWMQRAAVEELGVDPAFAAGAFPMSESANYFDTVRDLRSDRVEDYDLNRDLTYMDQFGMPYADVLAADDRVRAEQERIARNERQAFDDAVDAEREALYRSITTATGLSGEALSQTTDIDPDVLNDIVNDQSFTDALTELEMVAATGDIKRATESSRAIMEREPLLWRVIRALRPDLLEPVDYYGTEG